MPELPEVETVKNVLLKVFIGHTINKIDVLRKTTILGNVDTFINSLEGQKFLDITRIGKFLIFHLSNDMVFLSHLRMEGKYFDYLENEDNSKYARVVFHLDNGHKVCYDDSRCFGIMKLTNEINYQNEKEIASLGPEPFAIDDPSYLFNKYKKCNKPIKPLLLDQSIMTGLGNIYADEVLFKSKIHPLTPANMLSLDDCQNILDNSKETLLEAIEEGGSTIRSYHPGKDIDGNFQVRLLAYGKKDEPCPNCGTIMRFKIVGGRGSTYCPNCQIKRGAPIKVAIFGKIASGKSEVLNSFNKHCYPVISSDVIVHELYEEIDVTNHLLKMFKFENNEFSVDELRRIVVRDVKNKKKIEKYIHPLVKERIESFLERKNDLMFVEVPLLFEAKMESMFDYIIAVDVDEQTQIARLKKRNPSSYTQLSEINKNYNFDEKVKKSDFVIRNNSDFKSLDKQVKEIINILRSRL